MKIRALLPFLALAGLILSVGLACSTSTTPTVAPTNPPPVVVQPTEAQPVQVKPTQAKPVQVPPTEVPPATEVPTVEAPAFFTDHFDGDLSNWKYWIFSGDENKLTISNDNSRIITQLDDPKLAVYFFYDPYIYTDVALELVAENRGVNSNNINLVCRYSEEGWYEFTVQNDGLYSIWAYDEIGGSGYNQLYSGGSTAIKQGKDVNDIQVICSGTTLALYINGAETRSIEEKRFKLRDGQIGFGVNISASNPVTPVKVEFDSITIAQP